MQLVILHHHLNRGGVAQVVANHLRALATLPPEQQPRRVALVFDGQRDGWPDDVPGGDAQFSVELATTPEVGYDTDDSLAQPEQLARSIGDTLTAFGFDRADTVLHVHNHSLGKNAALPGALAILAGRGWRQLLQIHDFAEDNRPANYRHLAAALQLPAPEQLGPVLYPQAEHMHYATLTERDAAILGAAGVSAERLDPLPNPVSEFDSLPPADEARHRVFTKLSLPAEGRLFVYPVRGIRRKNLGEMLLLAALAPEDAWFAVTLAPKNPAEYASFDGWSALARRLGLRCRFDTAGEFGLAFHDALAAADAILTTSVAEGFGMVFLEAWLANRWLVGRDLPAITREFRAAGMEMTGLSEQLVVPFELLDRDAVRDDLRSTFLKVSAAYGVAALSETQLDAQLDELLSGSGTDFSRLTPQRQAALIESVAGDDGANEQLLAANPAVADALVTRQGDHAAQIAANADVVRAAYSTRTLGRRLHDAYQRVLGSSAQQPVEPLPGGGAVLDQLLTPRRILPVRVATWPTS